MLPCPPEHGSAHYTLTSISIGEGRVGPHTLRSNWLIAVHSPTLVPSSNRNGNDAFHF